MFEGSTKNEGPGLTRASDAAVDLGQRVHTLRTAARLTLKEVSERSGLSISSLSKIENNLLSPTYVSIIRLAKGLGVDIAELFSDQAKSRVIPHGRRSITRAQTGKTVRTSKYDYEMLCSDIVGKRMTPFKVVLRVNDTRNINDLVTHEGEELIYVLSGQVELRTEFYESIVLSPGDCAYYDSTMGHTCLPYGVEEAEVFWVCSSDDLLSVVKSHKLERT